VPRYFGESSGNIAKESTQGVTTPTSVVGVRLHGA